MPWRWCQGTDDRLTCSVPRGGLAVIGAFDAAHPRLTLADAAKRTGLTPTLSSLQVGDIAQPSMKALSEGVEESVSAAVLDGTETVYVARLPQGLRSIAAPLRDRNGRGQFLPALIETAGHVSAQLAKR